MAFAAPAHAQHTISVTSAAAISEGDTDAIHSFTLTRAGPAIASGQNLRISWAVSVAGGSAALADFQRSPQASLPAGASGYPGGSADTATTISFVVIGDALNEADETFTIAFSIAAADQAAATANGGVTLPNDFVVTITDDDPITATLSGGGNVNEGAAATVTVTLTGATATADVVVNYAGNADTEPATVTIATGATTGTLTITARNDAIAEGDEPVTVDASSVTATTAGTVTVAGSATLTIAANDDIAISVVADSAEARTGGMAEFTVSMSNASMADVSVAYTVAGVVDETGSVDIAASATTGNIAVDIPRDAVAEGEEGMLTVTLGAITVGAGGGMATAAAAPMNAATVTVTSDNSAARAARVEAPTAAVARGVGQLAAQAVVGRLTASVAGGNTLTVAGRDMAGDGMETLAAQYLAGGRDLSAAELLRQSGFSFTGGDGGRGFNFWGGGSYVSADGDHDGVTYDGDTTAFHVGVDTNWRDGLIGVAIGTSDGDTDFTVTADGMKSTLETDVTSVHPYLTRRLNNSQIYLTVGHGSGDAELKEDDAVIKTDLTVTTAAFGISHALGEQLAARAGALYSRAELDAAEGDGKSLPATDADSTRLTTGLEAAWLAGPWRLFLASDARHDSGDGDTGGALDLGGGVEWKSPTVFMRLEGGGRLLGQDAADEKRFDLVIRKSSGNLTLGLNLAADSAGLDTARLLHGEWRF